MSNLDLSSIVARYMNVYLEPDHSALISQLESHTYVKLKSDTNDEPSDMCKIMFINKDSVILEELLLNEAEWQTRFKLHKIMFEDWDAKFDRYVTELESISCDVDWEEGVYQIQDGIFDQYGISLDANPIY